MKGGGILPKGEKGEEVSDLSETGAYFYNSGTRANFPGWVHGRVKGEEDS